MARLSLVRAPLYLMVLLSGLAALSWEVLWQIQATLSLGVSARGAAVTLAATMAGMTLGAALMGRALQGLPGPLAIHPGRIYALLELLIGGSGLALLPAFQRIEALDRVLSAGHRSPALALGWHLGAIVLTLGPPALAMGATLPVFGLLARARRTSIAVLYGLNTAGAALGVLLMAFVLLPELGVALTAQLAACVNLAVAAAAWFLRGDAAAALSTDAPPAPSAPRRPSTSAAVLVFASGAVTFSLEVAWFRSLRAAFQSTTDSFAIILTAVLVPLAVGAPLAPWLRRRGVGLAQLLCGAGVAIILATPLIERFDILTELGGTSHGAVLLRWLALSLAVMGPAILLLGHVLPWVLDEHDAPAAWGRLYAINTLGAVVGSLGAAWVLLPTIGSTRTAWAAGLVVIALAAAITRRPVVRALFAALGTAALAVAVLGQAGVGTSRVQGRLEARGQRVLAHQEGPDSTISVIEDRAGVRILVIDGFDTTSEALGAHYMPWMGHLPMLLHPRPQRALVIAFGTGQTANAVRQEGPAELDIVDLNAPVLAMAPLFASNQGVLQDPRVHPHIMDGRAWLRRTEQRYDVVTMEPMPPNFAGVNALYSVEFYQQMAQRLNPGAIVAQWLPIHLLPPSHATAAAAAFCAVFPDALLWLDPLSKTGILVGRHGAGPGTPALGSEWPGLRRAAQGRDLSEAQIRQGVRLDAAGLRRYAALGTVITDDNQLLAYGRSRQEQLYYGELMVPVNLALIEKMARAR